MVNSLRWPHPPQELVQLSQRGVGLHRQFQPVEPVAVVHCRVSPERPGAFPECCYNRAAWVMVA